MAHFEWGNCEKCKQETWLKDGMCFNCNAVVKPPDALDTNDILKMFGMDK